MSSDKTPPKSAPKSGRKMLTEDRNAYTDTDAEGRQSIKKTVDRAEEASRQGVSEAHV